MLDAGWVYQGSIQASSLNDQVKVANMRKADYHIKVCEKVELPKRKIRLRVIMQDPDNTEGWAPAAPEYLVEEMAAWCEETGCGRRTAYDIFEFRDEQAAMMFKLRWM